MRYVLFYWLKMSCFILIHEYFIFIWLFLREQLRVFDNKKINQLALLNKINAKVMGHQHKIQYWLRNTGWAINNCAIRNLNISTLFQSNGLIIFVGDRGEFKVFLIRTTFINTVLNYHLWLEYRNLTFTEMVWTVFGNDFSFDFYFQPTHSIEKIVLFRSVQGRGRWFVPFRSYMYFPESPRNRPNDPWPP
jgi:hypothetical protein